MSDGPYRTPGEQLSDEERYRRAHTVYWAMMAQDRSVYDRMTDEQKAKFRADVARLRRVMTELGPRLRR